MPGECKIKWCTLSANRRKSWLGKVGNSVLLKKENIFLRKSITNFQVNKHFVWEKHILRFSSEWLPNFADSLFFRNFLEIETRCKIWGENYWSVIFQSLRKSWKAHKKWEKQSKRERLFPQINGKVCFPSLTRLAAVLLTSFRGKCHKLFQKWP